MEPKLLQLGVCHFSPGVCGPLHAWGKGCLGWAAHDQVVWIAIDFSGVVSVPGGMHRVQTVWSLHRGWGRPTGDDTAAAEPWKAQLPAGHVIRAQPIGEAVLVDLLTGVNEARSIWWCDADGAKQIRARVDARVRIEVIAPKIALLLDPQPHLELIVGGGDPLVIGLPGSLCADLADMPRGSARVLTAIPELGIVAIAGKHGGWWMRIGELCALVDGPQRRATWKLHHVFPTGNRQARVEGVVTMSAYGRTNIDIGNRKLSFGHTPLDKGERVTLVDLLWKQLGAEQYREVIRADGTRLTLPGSPGFEHEATTTIRATNKREKAKRS